MNAPVASPEQVHSALTALRSIWALPVPALLMDEALRIVDANAAFESFSATSRNQLIGLDAVDLQPIEDRSSDRLAIDDWLQALGPGDQHTMAERRMIDAAGRERWFKATFTVLPDVSGRWLLAIYQESTAERVARVQSERVQNELTQWFDLNRSGMLVYDASGLILRSNRAFDGLIGDVPVSLADAQEDLQGLLGWQGGLPDETLTTPGAAVENQALVRVPQGRRRLSARVCAIAGDVGRTRFMAIVEDRSAEDERDLAQLERGALMESASIGVATYDSQQGWVQAPRPVSARAVPAAGLQGIGRDMVDAGSLADYERLQQALRSGERAEVRYAVRHPELGQRWLLTRVEPGALAGGRRATSVVTLDVTEQEIGRMRNEQLLRELGTILDGSPVGIAYLRGQVLVRCNHVFERMMSIEPGAGAGSSLEEAFARSAAGLDAARAAVNAVREGSDFEGQFAYEGGRGGMRWYTLSVRGADAVADQVEVVAVLTDITRLKIQQAELETLLRDRDLMFSVSEVGIAYQRGARIERANQAMAAMTGYSAPELTALDGAELYESARACVEFEARMTAGLRQDGRFVGERLLRRRDGGLRWVQVGARSVDTNVQTDGVICSFVDVDELHRARESLLRQSERTRAILDSVLVGIVTVSDHGIEWMNRSARRMFGGELADFVGESISTVATPDADHPFRRKDYQERLAEGQAETFECRLRGRDGREFWVVGNAVVTSSETQGDQLTFALLDIESRRQAEVSVAQARSSLQSVIDTAPLAIALLDAESHEVLQRNQTAALFLDPAPVGLNQALASLSAQATDPQVHELRQVRDGLDADRFWDTRLVGLPAQSGTPAQLLVVASDVTERREADRARLQAAIAQREVLVKEVHHRIKNNLQGVAGLLQQHAERHPDVATLLGEAVSQVRAIAQVYGLQVGTSGLLRLGRVVEAIAQSVQRTFGREITVDAASEAAATLVLPEAESIPIALTLNELLTNAVKHGTGNVHCHLHPDGDTVAIELRHLGRLPDGFSVDHIRRGVSGLGLVRALLPRRSAELALQQRGEEVWTCVTLRPPSVQHDAAASISDNGHEEAAA